LLRALDQPFDLTSQIDRTLSAPPNPTNPPTELGNFPFNAETALSALAQGFITPTRQGYVRNHGAVPRLDRATHRLVVKGLGFARGGRSFTMDDLEALFPVRELGVTFCCSGNRRREVNAVKPSVGVPFGGGAVRTGVFKGVALVDVLAHCGFDKYVGRSGGGRGGHAGDDKKKDNCILK
jgi:sulfite oxidase